MLGIYRKEGKEEKAISLCSEVLNLCQDLGITEAISGATAYVNIGTVYKAFGKAASAMPHFEHARMIYEKYLRNDDDRLAGLYNNMALAFTDTGQFHEAEKMFLKALDVLSNVAGSEPEQAVTYLNIASCEEAAKGLEAAEDTISKCIDRAWNILDKPGLAHDGNYAFVCEKCASGFEYFGYMFYAETLRMRSEEIYNRNRQA